MLPGRLHAVPVDSNNKYDYRLARLEYREPGVHIGPHNVTRAERGVALERTATVRAVEDRNQEFKSAVAGGADPIGGGADNGECTGPSKGRRGEVHGVG